MSASTQERFAQDQFESPAQPLDASKKLYSFYEILEAPPSFQLVGEPVQLRCVGLENDLDGYNPTGVHDVKVYASDTHTTQVVTVRTEACEGAYAAESRFCSYEESGKLTELDLGERRQWEDAAMCILPDGRIITSGVHVKWQTDDPTKVDRFFTEYYSGYSLDEQTYLGQSPNGHKDSRLAVIDNELVLYTRPQLRSHEGKLHYTTLSSYTDLRGTPNDADEYVAHDIYNQAKPVGKGIFANDGTWGGANGPVELKNGWALIQCHVSHQVGWVATHETSGNSSSEIDELLDYDGFMVFHHPERDIAYIYGPHASIEHFPLGAVKWPKVQSVVFPGELSDVSIAPDGTIEGLSTFGVGDKRMFAQRWRSVVSFTKILNS
jgi:hypothetical protein